MKKKIIVFLILISLFSIAYNKNDSDRQADANANANADADANADAKSDAKADSKAVSSAKVDINIIESKFINQNLIYFI